MPFASYSKDNPLQDWYVQNLPNARIQLNQFPILDSIFNSLQNYETKSHLVRRNIFLDGIFPEIKGNTKTYAIKSLGEIEKALTALDYPNWNSTDQDELTNRITSEDHHDSLSVFTELLIANRMIQRVGISNVQIYPNVGNGNKSDLQILINNTNVNCEITNLATALPEKKIEKIFLEVTKYLEAKISTRSYLLRLHINTYELSKDSEGIIDVDKSIKLLKDEIDRLQLERIEGYEGYLTIERLDWLVNHENIVGTAGLDVIDHEISENLNRLPLSNWISLIKNELSKNSPIKAIGGQLFEMDTKPLIEIHSDDHYPSKSGDVEKESFLNHIIRRIDDKVNHGQMVTDAHNVIIVQAFNWLFSTYESTTNDFQPIHDKIVEYLESIKSKPLSGVLIFSNDFDSGIFIPNSYASENSKLSTEHLDALKFHSELNHTF